jgi:hypothetical protein
MIDGKDLELHGSGIFHVLCRHLPAGTWALLKSQARSCDICGGQSGTGVEFI